MLNRKWKWFGAFIVVVGFAACSDQNAGQEGTDGGISSSLTGGSSSLSDVGVSSSAPLVSSAVLSSGIVGSSGGQGVSSSASLQSSSVLPRSSSLIGSSSARSSSSAVNGVSSSSVDRLAAITRPCNGLMPPKISGGLSGWNSRYWDCCKPHCSSRENVDTNAVPFSICKNCDVNNQEIPAFRVSPNVNQWWFGYESTKSGCLSGGEAYACYSQTPYAVCDSLAYGYAAVPGNSASCGKCYQIDFDGGNHEGNVKEAHRLLKGKTMIVLASNIGHDVGSGQFDIMIPGGGVGAFEGGCRVQWGVDPNDENLVGKKYGGFLSKCQEKLGWDKPASQYKECVREMCQNLFGKDPKFKDLLDGCIWFVDWMHAADNPTFKYKEVPCPSELTAGYRSTINTSKDLPRP